MLECVGSIAFEIYRTVENLSVLRWIGRQLSAWVGTGAAPSSHPVYAGTPAWSRIRPHRFLSAGPQARHRAQSKREPEPGAAAATSICAVSGRRGADPSDGAGQAGFLADAD